MQDIGTFADLSLSLAVTICAWTRRAEESYHGCLGGVIPSSSVPAIGGSLTPIKGIGTGLCSLRPLSQPHGAKELNTRSLTNLARGLTKLQPTEVVQAVSTVFP